MSDFMAIHQSKVTRFEYSQLLRLVCIINTLNSLRISWSWLWCKIKSGTSSYNALEPSSNTMSIVLRYDCVWVCNSVKSTANGKPKCHPWSRSSMVTAMQPNAPKRYVKRKVACLKITWTQPTPVSGSGLGTMVAAIMSQCWLSPTVYFSLRRGGRLENK